MIDFLWHLAGKWDRLMERVENGSVKTIKTVHDKFLRKSGDRRKVDKAIDKTNKG